MAAETQRPLFSLQEKMEQPGEIVELAPDVYIVGGPVVQFMKYFPYNTRMTIIKLNNGDLFIHSPVQLTDAILRKGRELGTVGHIVAPNKIHHLFLGEWKKEFPSARVYSPSGLAKKRADVPFDGELDERMEVPWKDEIDLHVVRGSPFMEEVVFFHIPSSTLIVADLIENFPMEFIRENWGFFGRRLAKAWGIVAPNGKAPLEWRLSFLGKKSMTRQTYEKIVTQWRPNRIIVAHGVCIEAGGVQFAEASFKWMT